MHIPRPKEFVWLSVPYVWKDQVHIALIIIQVDHIFYDGWEWVIMSGGFKYKAIDCILCESIIVEETLGTKLDCEFI